MAWNMHTIRTELELTFGAVYINIKEPWLLKYNTDISNINVQHRYI